MLMFLYLWEVLNMIDFIWNWMTRSLRKKITTLEIDIKDYKMKIMENIKDLNKCKTDCLIKDNTIKELKLENVTNEEEEYWNNKWNHSAIRYKAQDGLYRDVRSLINYPSYIAEEVVLFNGLNKNTEEETFFAILNWIIKNIKYTGDLSTRKMPEFWEDSDITLQRKTGDCEDFALAFKTLCLTCGISDYKVKVVAGNVVTNSGIGGHCYPIVLHNDEWYVFDCTYYVDKTPLKDRIKARNDKRYLDIWWTFNKRHNFSQKTITIGR